MANLEADTLYYRFDHPNGYLFSAGNPEPSADDGWTIAQDDIGPPPEHTYECSTLAAYEALLNSERGSAAIAFTNASRLRDQLDSALTAVAMLHAQNQQLEEQLAALTPSPVTED